MNKLIFILSLLPALSHASSNMVYRVQDACQDNEKWTSSAERTPKWQNQFHDFAAFRVSPIFGFSEAVHLKRISALLVRADFERDFSEYWVGRILFRLNLDPLAQQVFRSVYENSEQIMLKKAALACMAQIEKRSPDYKISVGSDWMKLPFAANESQSDAETIFIASHAKANSLTPTLPEGYRDFLTGLDALNSKHYPKAIEAFEQVLKFADTHPKTLLDRYKDDARLFLGRAYYSVAKFKEASELFQKVKKSSNLQIDALSDLSWSYLLANEPDAAVGISMQLRTGALKNAFAPEPMMVTAMAFNELCLFPDSIRMIRTFVNDYGPSHDWLQNHLNDQNLYPEVLRVLKRQSQVPTKIASEWLKMPAFLTRQLSLNQLIEHPKRLADVQRKGAREQKDLTAQFGASVQKFIKDVQVAKLKLKPGEELSEIFGQRYVELRRSLRALTRYYQASKIWKNLARSYERKIPGYRTELVAKVNEDLKQRNVQILSLLNKVRENMDLIEVEIYNGASQDLIWKNAHPDYEKISESLTDRKEEESASKVWKWGRMLASEAEAAEVWEDEVGALKADVSNQCDKKDRYLKLKLIQK